MLIKHKLLMATTALVMMGATPALATTSDMGTQNHSPRVVNDQDGDIDYPNRNTVKLNSRATAAGIIGEAIYDTAGDAIATVDDILLDSEGNAELVVLADGEWFGMGKHVVFDYNMITTETANGDMMASVTEELIDDSRSFSYVATNDMDDVEMPDDYVRVSEILEGSLLNPENESVADVTNLTLKNGQANKIVVDVDENLSVTAHHVAMDFDALRMVQDDDGAPHFRLSVNQADAFERLKESL